MPKSKRKVKIAGMQKIQRTQRASKAYGRGGRAAALPQLPLELLAQVLQHDPLRHRLTAAAAVSRAWKEAAAATVTNISFKVTGSPGRKLRLTRMLAWAATQASHLTHLQLSDSYTEEVEKNTLLQQLLLPATAQLKSLDMENVQLQLGPGRGNAGILASVTALRSLRLWQSSIMDGATGLKYLSALTGLQDLCLSGRLAAGLCFPSGVLSRLVQLTSLTLHGVELPATATCNLSLLSGLKQLTLKTHTYAGRRL